MMFLKALDVAFVISMFVALTKLGEIVLDSAQQLSVQRSLNKVTLKLIDLNILRWYPLLKKSRISIPLFVVTCALQLALLDITSQGRALGYLRRERELGDLLVFLGFQIVLYVPLVKKLAVSRTRLRFGLNVLIGGVVSGTVFIVAFHYAELSLDYQSRHNLDPDVLFYILALAQMVLLPVVFISLFSALAAIQLILLGVVASSCYGALVLIRAILWRIVTYSKGAWAGLLFVMAGALGTVEILVRHPK